jgi:hypothetical protein
MLYKDLLRKFFQIYSSAGEIDPDPDAILTLRLGEAPDINIEYHQASESARISSTVGSIPEDHEEEALVYLELAEANYWWAGTSGATLGAFRETREVVLCYSYPMSGMDIQRLEDIVRGFSQVAVFWNQRLNQLENIKNEERKPQMEIANINLIV